MIEPASSNVPLRQIAKRIEAIYGKVIELREAAVATRRAKSLVPGARVYHSKFGKGEITAIEGEKFTIQFDDCGTLKNVLASFVFPAIEATPYQFPVRPIPSRLHCATKDAHTALEYAVWCIGETLMAFGGLEAMHQVLGLLEDGEHGARIGSWLDHRWDGVRIGNDGWHA